MSNRIVKGISFSWVELEQLDAQSEEEGIFRSECVRRTLMGAAKRGRPDPDGPGPLVRMRVRCPNCFEAIERWRKSNLASRPEVKVEARLFKDLAEYCLKLWEARKKYGS